jgi:hypothetical protein
VVFDAETPVVYHGKTTVVRGKTGHKVVVPGTLPQITYAGPWVEAMFLAGGRRPTARDLMSVLDTTGHLDDKALCASGGYSEGAPVVPLLQRCWRSVMEVATKLNREGLVGHEDVCSALGLTDDGGPGSFELALIRSGCAPGTFTTT